MAAGEAGANIYNLRSTPPDRRRTSNQGDLMTESVLRGVPPQSETSLRDLVTALLPQGFAKIVQPIASTTITTDTQGLVAGEVKIQTMTGPVPAYRAMPEKGGKLPVVLVVQEIFGVHEHIKDVCRRLAKLGYFAIAVDLYHRQGDVTKFTDNQEIFAKVVNFVPDSQVMSDLDASVVYAESTGKADTSRLGVTGFCWGGRITWTYCVHNPKVKAGVAWYGRLVAPAKAALQPAYPVELAPHLKVPVLGLYGGEDASIPVANVEQMRGALKSAGNTTSEIVVYDGAPHAFYADYRPNYRKEAAEDGWKRMQAWFKKYGVAPPSIQGVESNHDHESRLTPLRPSASVELEQPADRLGRLQAGAGQHQHRRLALPDRAAGDELRQPRGGGGRSRLDVEPLLRQRRERAHDLVLGHRHDLAAGGAHRREHFAHRASASTKRSPPRWSG